MYSIIPFTASLLLALSWFYYFPILAVFISPNPIENKMMRLQLAGMAGGGYSVNLINQAGQLLYNVHV